MDLMTLMLLKNVVKDINVYTLNVYIWSNDFIWSQFSFSL